VFKKTIDTIANTTHPDTLLILLNLFIERLL
jgi:hypothetical protein